MALIARIARLFKADLHAVLDQIEEPEPLLRQSIRDMEDELAEAERRVRARAQALAALGARRDELAARQGELDDELDLCFASGKDDLARGLVRRKLEAQRLAKTIASRLAEDEQRLADERAALGENRRVLESLQQKAELFARGEQDRADAACRDPLARDHAPSDDEVEVAWLREKAQRSAP